MESANDLVEYNYEALASITGGFSEENFIGNTLYGKVFRGKIQQDSETQEVVVKIWVDCMRYVTAPELQKSRFENEIKLLTNSDLKGHPNLVKLIGFYCETEWLGVVYELKPLDTLEKLILHDDFTWLARIKVALEFACLLECLHDKQLLHRSIGAAQIMIDQGFSPRLFDFAMLVGGGFGEIPSREYGIGCHGYVDPVIGLTGAWSDKSDVFSYGVILLGLIAKRVFDLKKAKDLGELNYVHIWAWTEYGEPSKKPRSKYFFGTEKPRSEFFFGTVTGKPRSKWGMFKKQKESQSNKSLVDKSLESDEYFDAGDGVEITKLAMRCVDYNPGQRPMMKEVVRCLRELNVVKKSSRVVVPKMSVGSSGGDGMESADTDLVEYNYDALASITGGFSEQNLIGNALYGKVFRGKIQQDSETQEVVVKIWVDSIRDATAPELQKSRFDNEIKLLTNLDLKGHPNLVKLIRFCCETEHLGVVYELKLLDTLEKLILHDDFTWLARIKVALEFACLLECLHDQQLLHRSIGAARIMIDQDFSPRLFDFAMLVGGGLGEIFSREYGFGCRGYIYPVISLTGAWSDKSDVFSYGVILLGLIAKRVFDLKKAKDLGELNAVYIWAWMEYGEPNKKPQCRYFKGTDTGKPRSKLWGMFKRQKESQSNKSLVDKSQLNKSLLDKSLESDEYFDAGDGVEITKLAMRCVDYYPEERPMMKEVVRCLRELNVVKKSSRIVVPKMSFGSSGGDGILLHE